MKDSLKFQGLWSVVGLLLILFVATLMGGVSYSDLLSNIGGFLTGNLNVIPKVNEDLMTVVLNTAAIIVMMIISAYAVVSITNRDTKSYAREELERTLEKGPWLLFWVVFLEEVIARWIFLGLIAAWIGGAPAFYACFIAGNAIWALIHMSNYKSESERSPLRVIPQFVVGLFLTYVFVRYGFWVAFMTHYLYDLVLLASFKKQSVGLTTLKRLGYFLALFLVSWVLAAFMGIGISSIKPWLNGQMVQLDLTFWQYAIMLLLIGSAIDAVAELLFLDVSQPSAETKWLLWKPEFHLFTIIVFTTMIVGGNWLLGTFGIDDPLVRALILTVIMSLVSPAKSGSEIARTTLVNMPSTYLTVAAFTVLGFGPAFGLSFIMMIAGYVPLLMKLEND